LHIALAVVVAAMGRASGIDVAAACVGFTSAALTGVAVHLATETFSPLLIIPICGVLIAVLVARSVVRIHVAVALQTALCAWFLSYGIGHPASHNLWIGAVIGFAAGRLPARGVGALMGAENGMMLALTLSDPHSSSGDFWGTMSIVAYTVAGIAVTPLFCAHATDAEQAGDE
jgi:hypothetical protein